MGRDMSKLTIRGIPKSLKDDGWWLETGTGSCSGGPQIRSTEFRRGFGSGPAILIAMIVLADRLFWGHTPGISLAIFTIVLCLVIWLWSGRTFRGENGLKGLTIIIATVLPVVESAHFLSVAFLFFGTSLFAAWVMLKPTTDALGILTGLWRFISVFPMLGTLDLGRMAVSSTTGGQTRGFWQNLLKGWLLPLVVGTVFIGLLAVANPILEDWLDRILSNRMTSIASVERGFFWILAAAMTWPFIALEKFRDWIAIPFQRKSRSIGRSEKLGLINLNSVTNSLVLFNLIFAVQTGLDFVFLWSGAEMPAGISHASYAHRGAYPLVATAILAGLFSLISRPFAGESDLLLWMLSIWIGQNILLVLASLYRLDTYVGSFGLTYFRIAAGIWMGLVASGLALIGWQIWYRHSNGWLVKANALLLAGVIYSCCFANFPHIIASSNLAQSLNAENNRPVDEHYLCNLGPFAAAALRAHFLRTGRAFCFGTETALAPDSYSWRDWGFRKTRVRVYLATHPEFGRTLEKN